MSDGSSSSHAIPLHQRIAEDDDVNDVLVMAAENARARKHMKEMFNRVRVDLLTDLVRNLDILVYAELSAIYYMDCHTLRFLLRVFVQFMFWAPRSPLLQTIGRSEPYVGAIIGSNVLCFILHIFSEAPSAGEATRFYMHGGLLIDFVGQRGPTSKLLLLALDIFVLVLQLVHLSAHVTRQKLKDTLSSRQTQTSTQDLDSEERGVRRSAELVQEQVQQGIELQSLNNAGRALNIEVEDHRPLDNTPFDAWTNGQIVLADLNPIRTIRDQITDFNKIPAETRRRTINSQLASRLAGLRILTGRAMNR